MNSTNILVPNLPESVSNAVVAVWNKKTGDEVQQGEILVELETDKIMLEIPAKESGILEIILEKVGNIVISGQILGKILSYNSNKQCDQNIKKEPLNQESFSENDESKNVFKKDILKKNDDYVKNFSPSTRRLIKEYDLKPELVLTSNFHEKITRKNIEKYLLHSKNTKKHFHSTSVSSTEQENPFRTETRVPMSRIRQCIAERLLNVKNNTAMLTTFNEVNMQPIIDLRKRYGEIFEKKHNIRLGFMSFYVKAVLEALRSFPEINASIDGKDIVYHNYFDISIAVSTERGLVTPVLRNINLFSIADIEKKIKILADKGKNGKLTLDELSGGNFTITNGGVFGSLMSTPIINPPQSAILGMHAIKDRPMVINGEIVILPMMYLALSYDHRLIDGKDSIHFLMKIKDIIENPMKFLLEL